MKRKRPTSKIWHTALYLRNVMCYHTFTAREIHLAMSLARIYYHSLIPDSVIAERDRLLAAYKCDDCLEYGPYVYRVDGRSYTWPFTFDDLAELNTKLRKLFKPYITIDYPYYSENLVHAEVSNCFKYGYLLRNESRTPFVYRLNPDYLED
jgi:hypothetical protein